MPEMPDLTVYVEALRERLLDQTVDAIEFGSPFVLRSVEPPPAEWIGRQVVAVDRIGKRIVLSDSSELHLVIHLMIAGRLHWYPSGTRIPGRKSLFTLRTGSGTLTMTEAGTKRRAAVHLVRGKAALRALGRGGLEPLEATAAEFSECLRRENHTLKRALTDPRLLAGIGNAYSDEILHRAGLSPLDLTSRLSTDEMSRLFDATRATLSEWISRLMAATGDAFPEKVTAFRDGMAVHGRFGKPCPDCGAPVQRIRYAENETNYCAVCQTDGRLLADRALSRLLREDWPRTIEEW